MIFILLKFCDPHAFDYPYIKALLDSAGIPSLLFEVEEGKRLTYGMAGRKGWEDRRTEVEQWLAGKRTEYIL